METPPSDQAVSTEAINVLSLAQRQQALAWASGELQRSSEERKMLYVRVACGLLREDIAGWVRWANGCESCDWATGLERYSRAFENGPFDGIVPGFQIVPAKDIIARCGSHPVARLLNEDGALLVWASIPHRDAGMGLFVVMRRSTLVDSERHSLDALVKLLAAESSSQAWSRTAFELRPGIGSNDRGTYSESLEAARSYRPSVHQLTGYILFVFDRALTFRFADGAIPFPGVAGAPQELVGRSIRELCSEGIENGFLEACSVALAGKQTAVPLLVSERGYELSTAPLSDGGGSTLYGVGLLREVSRVSECEKTDRLFSAQLRTLVDSIDAGIVIEDAMQLVQYCNQHFCDLMQLSEPPTSIIGKPSTELVARIGPAFFIPEALEERITELKASRQVSRDELVYLADMRILERSYSPLVLDGQGLGHLWSYRDVTDRERNKDLLQRQADELRALSLVDELTGLYNRRGFLTLSTQQLKLCDRSMRPALLVFVDLDGMKRINDELGHEYGDQALVETASVLRQCFRYSDVVARLGGDEFVVLAVEADPPLGDLVVERLYERLAEMNAKPGRKFTLSFSVGVTPYDPSKLEMVEEVLARADSLMYEQKRQRKMERKV